MAIQEMLGKRDPRLRFSTFKCLDCRRDAATSPTAFYTDKNEQIVCAPCLNKRGEAEHFTPELEPWFEVIGEAQGVPILAGSTTSTALGG